LIVFATVALLTGTAEAQTVDELWDRYEALATEYEDLQTECDEGDRATTYINRICRGAAEQSLELADVIEELLGADTSLVEADRELLIDGMLTNRQIAGALWVELGECEIGKPILDDVLGRPEVESRQIVAQAAATWQVRAQECIAEAQALERAPDIESPRHTAPILVMSSGLAFLVGGVIWDLALIGPRGEFTDLVDECSNIDSPNVCDRERLEQLQGNLNSAKVPIVLLYGVGSAAAVTGAVWYLVARSSGSDNAQAVSIAPQFGPTFTGAQVSWSF
jgi:hypothetical protein